MKSVLISIQPKWCELIASGEKTIEVRKTRPKIDTPFKVYIYCTLSGSNEFFREDCKGDIAEWNRSKMALKKGKVIGEFVCDNVKMSFVGYNEKGLPSYWDILDGSCLTPNELVCYGGFKTLYGWHISDLVIYDKPKELNEFYTECQMNCEHCEMWGSVRVNAEEFDMDCKSDWFNHKPLKRPPQSWCYVEELEV